MDNESSKVGENGPTDKTVQDIEDMVGDLADDALDSLAQPKKKRESAKSEDETETESEQAEEEKEGLDSDSSEDSEGDEDDEETDIDEDVVPKSKHEKIVEKMRKRIDQLTSEKKVSLDKERAKADTPEEKLLNLSHQELLDLMENVDESIMDAKVAQKVDGEDMSEKITKLKDLKKLAAKTIKDMPNRFVNKQLSHLEDMIEVVKDLDPNVSEKQGDLWAIANKIYKRSNSLQVSETGQAEALALAAEYYLDTKKLSGGREKADALSQKVSSLKKKTALDGKTRKGNAEFASTKKIRDKAITGNYYDKLDFVQTLIPDDFLQ